MERQLNEIFQYNDYLLIALLRNKDETCLNCELNSKHYYCFDIHNLNICGSCVDNDISTHFLFKKYINGKKVK